MYERPAASHLKHLLKPATTWACPTICHTENAGGDTECSVCGTRKPRTTASLPSYRRPDTGKARADTAVAVDTLAEALKSVRSR
jgi:hypothetical protein